MIIRKKKKQRESIRIQESLKTLVTLGELLLMKNGLISLAWCLGWAPNINIFNKLSLILMYSQRLELI